VKFLIAVFFVVFSQVSFAKNTLVDDCSHLKEASEAQFTLFNKTEFIQLGECLAVHTIKRGPITDLPMLCDEVREDDSTPLGNWSLTKLEAIYIGQCVGVINYIYQRYNEESVSLNNYRYGRSKKYYCVRGESAVKILRESNHEESNRADILNLLCTQR
jgi:hypothetical protein